MTKRNVVEVDAATSRLIDTFLRDNLTEDGNKSYKSALTKRALELSRERRGNSIYFYFNFCFVLIFVFCFPLQPGF